MTVHETDRRGPHVAAQMAAAWAAFDEASRSEALWETLSAQDRAYAAATAEMAKVHEFIGSPESILGSAKTKHGEIAEQVHVGVRRAMDVLHGRAPTATFEGVGRLDAVDYREGGVDVQSKYLNGIRRTLDHVLGHGEQYPEFPQGKNVYHVPKDQHAQLQELARTGKIEGLSERSVRAIEGKLERLQDMAGRPADEVVQPGETTYAEVQRGRVHETLRDREAGLRSEDERLREHARSDHGPSWGGLGQAAALGGAAGGGVRLGQALWVKWREGKNPFAGDFTAQDWKDVGLEMAQGAGTGAIAGGALYVLTNATDLAAPFAGALVSSLMGIGGLLKQYHGGTIGADEFVEMSQLIGVDAAIVGLSSAAGQALIPIPVLGALVGSLAGKLAASALKSSLGNSELELVARLQAYEQNALIRLDSEYAALIERLDQHFGELERLTRLAFDEAINTSLRLRVSIELAETLGVPDEVILRRTEDLDAFMME